MHDVGWFWQTLCIFTFERERTQMKKIISFILAVVLMLSFVPTAFAASDEALDAADKLNALGLFSGTGTDADGKPIYELDRAPTRQEAIVMLIRLLGKIDEAKAGNWDMPFTDVADWAKPYVGYAYANKFASGTSATTFGGDATVTAAQYLTFVLRALGYKVNTDFYWDKAWELSDKLGITDGRYDENTTSFTRGDAAIVSYNALSATKKDAAQAENLLYEDPYVKIQYLKYVLDEEYSYGGATYKLHFLVTNKGLTSVSGKDYSDIWVFASDVSIEGNQTSVTPMGMVDAGVVVPSGKSVELVSNYFADGDELADGLAQLAALFNVKFGYHNGAGNTFHDGGFDVVHETDASTGVVSLSGGAISKEVPASEGTLIYSDNNLDLYFVDHCYTVSYNVRNKTDKTINLDCKSVSVMGEVSEDTGFMFTSRDYVCILPYSLSYVEVVGVPDEDPETDVVGIVLDVTVGTQKYTITIEDTYKPLSSEDYAYLAGTDFRSIRRDYSQAVAQHGYVYAFIDLNGDLCVLTHVNFKIISNYYQVTLHNITKGTKIVDPVNYYEKMADRAFGASRLHYIDLALEVNRHHLDMLKALQSIMETGTNTFDGAYVPASILNL